MTPKQSKRSERKLNKLKENKLEELAKREIEKLIIISPAFLADGLETLEELDIEIREHYAEHGGGKLEVISCLNDNSDWIEGLSSLVRRRFSTLPVMES